MAMQGPHVASASASTSRASAGIQLEPSELEALGGKRCQRTATGRRGSPLGSEIVREWFVVKRVPAATPIILFYEQFHNTAVSNFTKK